MVLTVLEKTGAKVSDFYVVLQKLEINSIFHFSPPLTNDIAMSAGPAQPPPPQPPAPVKPWKFLEPPPQWLFSKEVSCVRSNVASCGIFFFDKIVKTICSGCSPLRPVYTCVPGCNMSLLQGLVATVAAPGYAIFFEAF